MYLLRYGPGRTREHCCSGGSAPRTRQQLRTLWKGATVGAAAIGLPAIMVSLASPYNSRGVIVVVILTWAVVAIGYVIANWVHARRENAN